MGNRITFDEISQQLCSIYRVTLCSFQNEVQNDSPYLVRYGQLESVIGNLCKETTEKKGVCPETKWVEGSNYVDVNFVIDERTGRVVMMGALDNLVKGAAGQAVQNMNLLFGFDEAEGLSMVPMFP